MVQEDYVLFEVAELLKNKGFDEYCRAIYAEGETEIEITDEYWRNTDSDIREIDDEDDDSFVFITAPTHQMTLKWLREEHGIIITIDFDEYELTSDNKKVGYGYNIQKIENPTEYFKISTMVYDSYEEACEAAIKYVLENLI